ncbi:MAG TPA: tRNA preQ1(34) S-adenosylmethionine ribosyltransferase-isomerase QueA [Acidimicrobiales bacterium]|nr:tRNA preQ1(34) S-adenosylmethionine ribosyltransferase-isomerase QueA [Acidimicrobiales bacterium]
MTRVDAFEYQLPPEAIAQQPVEPRDAARLLVSLDAGAPPQHRHVRDLPDLLEPGDLLVVNDTRVRPARLHLHKETGGAAEVLLLEPAGPSSLAWEALVRPGRRLPPGTRLFGNDGTAVVEVGEPVGDDGRRLVTLLDDPDRHGTVPLPPYITEALADPERYQTVYAARPGSVAAPTAGLHLSRDVLDRCAAKGVGLARVELVVGLDTFRPIATEAVEDHVMHSERYTVPAETLDACAAARRVVAVGTTSVRALESAAARGEMEGRTDLFISGDYPFKVVDVLLTNFHLPRSTLLVLLEAFCGPGWRTLYDEALAEGYRFLSFGDAMLVSRRP